MTRLRHHFAILEIPANASYEEAKAAYRDMVNVWHPDKFEQNSRLQEKATEKLKQINTAWRHLDVYYRTERADRDDRGNKDAAGNGQTCREESSGRADNGKSGMGQVRCRACDTLNNLPNEVPLYFAKCGSCGSYLSIERQEENRLKRLERNLAPALSPKPGHPGETISVGDLALGLSVGLVVMLLLFILKYSLY